MCSFKVEVSAGITCAGSPLSFSLQPLFSLCLQICLHHIILTAYKGPSEWWQHKYPYISFIFPFPFNLYFPFSVCHFSFLCCIFIFVSLLPHFTTDFCYWHVAHHCEARSRQNYRLCGMNDTVTNGLIDFE